MWYFICTNSRIKRQGSIRPPCFYDGMGRNFRLVCFIFPKGFVTIKWNSVKYFLLVLLQHGFIDFIDYSIRAKNCFENHKQYCKWKFWTPLGGLLLRHIRFQLCICFQKGKNGFLTVISIALKITSPPLGSYWLLNRNDMVDVNI